jgi:methionine-rich copper-binding protein CopC
MPQFASAVLLAIALLWPGLAAAHAIVVDSQPAAGATVRGDLMVEIYFNNRIDQKRSRLSLVDPGGTERVLALEPDAPVDALRAHVGALAPGGWKLNWQVLAVDGHITRGEIPFQCGP